MWILNRAQALTGKKFVLNIFFTKLFTTFSSIDAQGFIKIGIFNKRLKQGRNFSFFIVGTKIFAGHLEIITRP